MGISGAPPQGTERTVAQALRLAMERQGLTYATLAERTGQPTATVHKALNRAGEADRGERGMMEANIVRFCQAMNIGLRYRPGDGWHPTE